MTDAMYEQWIGRKLLGRDGTRIGRIDQIYVDEHTGEPAWLTVHTGFFGARTSFVPLQGATPEGDHLTVPYTKDEVKNAPNIRPENGLMMTDERTLAAYYSADAAAPRRRRPPGSAEAPGGAAMQ